jgi:hypothetical protein
MSFNVQNTFVTPGNVETALGDVTSSVLGNVVVYSGLILAGSTVGDRIVYSADRVTPLQLPVGVIVTAVSLNGVNTGSSVHTIKLGTSLAASGATLYASPATTPSLAHGGVVVPGATSVGSVTSSNYVWSTVATATASNDLVLKLSVLDSRL